MQTIAVLNISLLVIVPTRMKRRNRRRHFTEKGEDLERKEGQIVYKIHNFVGGESGDEFIFPFTCTDFLFNPQCGYWSLRIQLYLLGGWTLIRGLLFTAEPATVWKHSGFKAVESTTLQRGY